LVGRLTPFMASVAEDTDRLTRLMDRLLLDVSTLAAMNAGNAALSLAAATPKRAGLLRSASNGAAPQQQEDGGGADGGRSFTCWPALAELGGGGSSNGTPGRGGSGNHSAESTLVVCSARYRKRNSTAGHTTDTENRYARSTFRKYILCPFPNSKSSVECRGFPSRVGFPPAQPPGDGSVLPHCVLPSVSHTEQLNNILVIMRTRIHVVCNM
jgi:hypothetical protein